MRSSRNVEVGGFYRSRDARPPPPLRPKLKSVTPRVFLAGVGPDLRTDAISASFYNWFNLSAKSPKSVQPTVDADFGGDPSRATQSEGTRASEALLAAFDWPGAQWEPLDASTRSHARRISASNRPDRRRAFQKIPKPGIFTALERRQRTSREPTGAHGARVSSGAPNTARRRTP